MIENQVEEIPSKPFNYQIFLWIIAGLFSILQTITFLIYVDMRSTVSTNTGIIKENTVEISNLKVLMEEHRVEEKRLEDAKLDKESYYRDIGEIKDNVHRLILMHEHQGYK